MGHRRIRDRALHGRNRSLMQYEVHAIDRLARYGLIGQVTLDKFHFRTPGIETANPPRGEIVNHADLGAALGQAFNDVRADEAGTPSN